MRGSKAIPRSRRKLSLLACSLLALAVAAPASAQDPPDPGDISAADAYRESIPTAAGPKPSGERGQRGSLSPSVATRLSGLPALEASLLRDVATSPAFGAPRSTLRREEGPAPALDARSLPSVPAAAEAIGDAFGVRLMFLALLLGAITAVAVAARLAQARVR